MTTKANEYQEVKLKSNYIKFNKLNDYIKGTLVGVFTPTSPDNFGKMDKKYTILCEEGTVHGGVMDQETGNYVVNNDATVLEKGESYIVTGKASLDKRMKEIKEGQKCIIQLSEIRPNPKPGMRASKIITVLAGGMDANYATPAPATDVDAVMDTM